MVSKPAIVGIASWLMLAALPASAQLTSAGTVSGQVTDQQSAAVENAQVFLNDTSTDAKRQTTTNDTGRYIFLNVAPGRYDLGVRATGFSQAARPARAGRRRPHARHQAPGGRRIEHRRSAGRRGR